MNIVNRIARIVCSLALIFGVYTNSLGMDKKKKKQTAGQTATQTPKAEAPKLETKAPKQESVGAQKKGPKPKTSDAEKRLALERLLFQPASPKNIAQDPDAKLASLVSELHGIIQRQNYPAFQKILADNPTLIQQLVTQKNTFGWAAIHYATGNTSPQQINFVKDLLEHGADIHDIADSGADNNTNGTPNLYNRRTPLLIAVKNGFVDTVRYLLKLAPIHLLKSAQKSMNNAVPADTLKTFYPRLSYTSRGQNINIVIEAFKCGRTTEQLQNIDMGIVTTEKLDQTKEDIVKLLLEYKDADKKDVVDFKLKTAEGLNLLHLAAQYGMKSVLPILILKGLSVDDTIDNPDVADKADKADVKGIAGTQEVKEIKEVKETVNTSTVRSCACDIKDTDNKEVKDAKKVINHGYGATPLFMAAWAGKLETVQALILEHKAAIDKPNSRGETPLFIALDRGHANIAKFLIAHGADVNIRSHTGATTMHAAANHPHLNSIVELLLSKGATITSDKTGHTPVHAAAENNARETLEIFIHEKCKLDEQMHAEDAKRFTPLMLAALNGHVEVVQRLLETKQVDINKHGPYGATPLLIALQCNKPAVARLLIDAQADPLLCSTQGWNALHMTILHKELLELSQELISKHPGISTARISTGLNALHLAVQKNRADLIPLFINDGFIKDGCLVDEPVDAAKKENNDCNKGRTAFMIAASQESVDVLKKLIKDYKADIKKIGPDGYTVLHYAVMSEKIDNVKFVLEVMRDQKILAHFINLANNDGWTPLHFAAEEDNLAPIAEELLKAGAKKTTVTKTGHTPQHVAAQHNALDVLKILSNDGRIGLGKLTARSDDHKISAESQSFSLLMAAAAAPHDRAHLVADWLISKHPQSINISNKANRTALHYAAGSGSVKTAQLLLSNKQYKAYLASKTRAGYSALDIAAETGHVEIIQCFIDDIKQNTPDTKLATLWKDEKNQKNDHTPLTLAAKDGRKACCQLLLTTGIDLHAQERFDGFNALHYAVYNGHANIARILLEKDRSLLTTITHEGRTPLMLAAFKGRHEIIKMLVTEFDADVNTQHNNNTALNLAIKQKHDAAVNTLLECKASVTQFDKDGFLPLHSAAYQGKTDMVKFLLEASKAADINTINTLVKKTGTIYDNYTPLMVAARRGHDDTALALLDAAGASIDYKTPESHQSVASLAVQFGLQKVIARLIEQKVPINLKYRDNGKTTLHYAAQYGFAHIIHHLIVDLRMDAIQEDAEGKKALDYAPADKKELIAQSIIEGCEALLKRIKSSSAAGQNTDVKESQMASSHAQDKADTKRGEEKEAGEEDDDAEDREDTEDTNILVPDDHKEDTEKSKASTREESSEDADDEDDFFQRFHPNARKQFKELDSKVAVIIKEEINELLTNPAQKHAKSKKMAGKENHWRIKVTRNQPRVIYYRNPKDNSIVIKKIDARKKVYKR